MGVYRDRDDGSSSGCGQTRRLRKPGLPGRQSVCAADAHRDAAPIREPLEHIIIPVVPFDICAKYVRERLTELAKRPHDEIVDQIGKMRGAMESGCARSGKRGRPRYYGGNGKSLSVRVRKSLVAKLRPAADEAKASWTHAVAAALAFAA
jgi:hypothetical protein